MSARRKPEQFESARRIGRTVAGMATILAFVSSGSVSAYDGTCSTAQDVADLPPGHWCEVPNSHLEDAEKKPQDYADFNGSSSSDYNSIQGNNGVAAIMGNWSGGTFDTRRDRLIIFGGGHHGYFGNELYAFSLVDLTWERLTDPAAPPTKDGTGYRYIDGTPESRHTYDGVEYMSNEDFIFAHAGAGSPEGGHAPGTWLFDLGASEANGDTSTNSQFWIEASNTNEPGSTPDQITHYDPVSSLVYFHNATTPQRVGSYNHVEDEWTQRSSRGHDSSAFGVLDPVRRKIYVFGGSGSPDSLVVWDIPDDENDSMPHQIVSTFGAKGIESADDPGIAYDVPTGHFVAYDGGTDVYEFDPDTNTWGRHTEAAGNLADPGPVTAAGGIFGRFRYSANLNVYVYVDSVDSNVFLYRFAPGLARPRAPTELQAD